MRNTMGASAAENREIRELTAAQQALGVIGDDVQQEGAQELATYLELTSSLKTLIPAPPAAYSLSSSISAAAPRLSGKTSSKLGTSLAHTAARMSSAWS